MMSKALFPISLIERGLRVHRGFDSGQTGNGNANRAIVASEKDEQEFLSHLIHLVHRRLPWYLHYSMDDTHPLPEPTSLQPPALVDCENSMPKT